RSWRRAAPANCPRTMKSAPPTLDEAVMNQNVTDLPVRELARRIAHGDLAAAEVAAAFIERIEALATVRAWASFDPEAVLRQARAVDAGGGARPLAGVPVGVKDLMDTAGIPTAYGSPIYAGHVPRRDAACV